MAWGDGLPNSILPHNILPVLPKETGSMQTRDGVRLDADLYYPDAVGEFPVLLMRQPYGRAIASTVVYAHPRWYAAHGYIVVIQDVRGRGTSEGKFDLFAHEINDGYDSVAWAAQLPRSSGQVGMYGFSYQGMTQLYAAIAQPPALKTICPSMVAYDLYADWAYEGGAFCYQLNFGWAAQLAAETARRQGDLDAYRALYQAARSSSLSDPVCPRSDLLERLTPDSFYHDWLIHSDPSADYWQRSPHTQLSVVDLPMLHIGGWFDTFLRGTLKLYDAMAARSQFPQHLWVGPWAHLPWGRYAGAVDFGAAANSPIDALQIRWFDQFLKGIDTGLLNDPPICLFEMGSNHWRKFDHFPTTCQQSFGLASTGLAAMSDQDGTLQPRASQQDLSPAETSRDRLLVPDIPVRDIPVRDILVHDPWRPVPVQGGHATAPAGGFNRAALDCRTDILTYTSAPLTADLRLAGAIAVELACTADTPSVDLCATLSTVNPDGSVFNFSQGYLRVNPHHPDSDSALASVTDAEPSPSNPTQPWAIALQPTCICIPQGHALRLSLSAACFPAFPVNPGTGTPPHQSRLLDAQVITLSVFTGEAGGSQLIVTLAE